MSTDLSEFHGMFFEECFEALDDMESGLLNLDVGAADMENINTIFRGAHSIKGGSGMFGFTDVTNFTHVLETLLDEMRDGKRQVVQATVELMLQSVDCLRAMLKAIQNGNGVDKDEVGVLQKKLEQELNNQDAEHGVEAVPTPVTGGAVAVSVWRIRFKPFADMLKTGNDPHRIIRELAELGVLESHADVAGVPRFDSLDPKKCYLAWEFTLTGAVEQQQITEVFDWVEGNCELEISLQTDEPMEIAATVPEMIVAEQSSGEPKTDTKPEPAPDAVERRADGRREGGDRRKSDRRGKAAGEDSGSIRVGIDKIDAIINQVGELVITQSMLDRFGEDSDMSELDGLRDGLIQLSRNTRELQESVMQIRMLPISSSFNRFPRLVRDLSNKLGKKVELVFSGEQTELDKTVLEKISDPLVHLVRNSLDHGIETPEVRVAAGKPETGTLHLNAYHAGGHIVIEIHDDGAGLPRGKILNKAREKELVGVDEELSDEQILNLIFHAGFSTADNISEVSGRGVGMDVVQRNIKDLGGTIEVRSEEGKGSTFTIQLPLTLAILDGQLLKVGAQTYVISLVSIVESLRIKPGMVNSLAGKSELYKLRDEYIPIVRLYEIFDIQPQVTDLQQGLVVVVEANDVRVGLFIDDLLGQQQVVIKSLETNFQQVEGLSGATILGDGMVALIIDVPGLIQRYVQTREVEQAAIAAA
jgi:two-component system, chemotaxis family, sensor kinase CheA